MAIVSANDVVIETESQPQPKTPGSKSPILTNQMQQAVSSADCKIERVKSVDSGADNLLNEHSPRTSREASSACVEVHAANLGLLSKPPILGQLSNRSLTIDELAKLHENMNLFSYNEPTDEQFPYRPKCSHPLSPIKI